MPDCGSPSGVSQDTQAPGGSPLFRERAVRTLGERWFGPVQVVTPPSVVAVSGIAATALTMLVVAVMVIEIPDRVRTVGVLLPAEGMLKVKASRAGRVERLAISNGDAVSRGQVLMRIATVQKAPDQEPEIAARIASLERELMLTDRMLERELAAVDARMQFNRRRLDLTRKRIEAAEAEQRTRDSQARLNELRAARVGQLAHAHAVSEHVADEVAATALQAAATSQSALQHVLSLRNELLLIEQQLAQDDANRGLMQSRAGARREEIARQLAASELQSALEVIAPDAGVVTGLTVRVGEDVRAGEVLVTLHDPGSRLEAQLYLTPDNAGMIVAGQLVELQLKAYPHQLYGTHTAIVSSVSPVALPAEEIDPGLPLKGPVFVVRAKLQDRVVNAHGRVWALPPGTSFSADLVRYRWPLYRWLVRSVSGATPYS